MRIVDKDNKELDPNKLDLRKGHLVDDKIFVKHHDAQEKVEEVSHYETVRVYSNGGMDVEKVIDTPGQEAKDAYDEYEDVQRYIEYTQSELDTQDKSTATAVVNGNMNDQIMTAMPYLIAQMSTMIDDNAAGQFPGLFETFEEGNEYPAKTIVRYKTGLYRVIQDVPENTEGTPDSLDGTYFERIERPDLMDPDENMGNNDVYSWLSPAKIDQTYSEGDIVLWKGSKWRSDRNYNAFEPGAQGWTEYTD